MFPSPFVDDVSKIDSSTLGMCILALLTIYVTNWLYRWRNPKCNGKLPPGSMGLPFIGETLGLFLPKSSIDVLPFIKTRIQRYGPIFRTNLGGIPAIVTADREFNYFLLKQDEKLIDTLLIGTFENIFPKSDVGVERRKLAKKMVYDHFGIEPLKHKLIPRMEDGIRKAFHAWSSMESLELNRATITLAAHVKAKEIFSNDFDNASFKVSDMVYDIVSGFMSLPLNIPGTAHHKCLKGNKQLSEVLMAVLKKRRSSNDDSREDFLNRVIKEATNNSCLPDEFIIIFLIGTLLTAYSIGQDCTLALKLIAGRPDVLKELTAEHEELLKKRENNDLPLTWNEYKSMTYTHQVINEILRFGDSAPVLFRRAVKDISINGYTIPEGWRVLIASSAIHMSPIPFEDPLRFNPKRWQELKSNETLKSFMPFGFGMRQCPGAEYSRVFLSIFMHVLVTKYSWKVLKGGKVTRAPLFSFPEGLQVKITEKQS